MADLPELSDHIYEQYRTYLFKYNKALEIIKAQEIIESENEKLKIENLTLKLQLREIKIEKTAADFTAQTKMRMMREELEKMMKKTMNRKLLTSSELRKLDSDKTINRTSDWVNSQKARTRKRKLGLNLKAIPLIKKTF
jgi:DNA gyrase/topoisomerase IV subunit B